MTSDASVASVWRTSRRMLCCLSRNCLWINFSSKKNFHDFDICCKKNIFLFEIFWRSNTKFCFKLLSHFCSLITILQIVGTLTVKRFSFFYFFHFCSKTGQGWNRRLHTFFQNFWETFFLFVAIENFFSSEKQFLSSSIKTKGANWPKQFSSSSLSSLSLLSLLLSSLLSLSSVSSSSHFHLTPTFTSHQKLIKFFLFNFQLHGGCEKILNFGWRCKRKKNLSLTFFLHKVDIALLFFIADKVEMVVIFLRRCSFRHKWIVKAFKCVDGNLIDLEHMSCFNEMVYPLRPIFLKVRGSEQLIFLIICCSLLLNKFKPTLEPTRIVHFSVSLVAPKSGGVYLWPTNWRLNEI